MKDAPDLRIGSEVTCKRDGNVYARILTGHKTDPSWLQLLRNLKLNSSVILTTTKEFLCAQNDIEKSRATTDY